MNRQVNNLKLHVDKHDLTLPKLQAQMVDLTGSRSDNFKLKIMDSLEVKYAEISEKFVIREAELLAAIERA